ncbi:MAG TPA: PhzF family phenazine biosynthesis protein [Anaerolineaceae bacterium]|nr:PhzF family phenazine biosynthesis protein [Anaerolineaceae bacterium]HPN54045.1 PhzF family phenazine biosynthesis protein [Anaerolineaceae bacterium]
MEKILRFKKIDAFTNGESVGNPAGYVFMPGDRLLSDVEMQRLAAELKGFVNEVGFVYQKEDDLYLRFFSSECEVAFCGHATIAILYDLMSNAEGYGPTEVTIHVNAGPLKVYDFITSDQAVYITAPRPANLPCSIHREQAARALGLLPEDLNPAWPVRLVDGGLRTLIVPLASLDRCLEMHPDQEALRLFCLAHDFDIVHVSVLETSQADCQFRTRVFAPKYGYLEDPATGSGNAAFGYYLTNEGLWTGNLTVEQGPSREKPNRVKLRKVEQDGEVRMLFGGCATTRIEGNYHLFC